MIIQEMIEGKIFNKWWLIKKDKVFVFPYEWKENRVNLYSIYKREGCYFFELVSCLDREFLKLELLRVPNDVDLNAILAKKLLVKK